MEEDLKDINNEEINEQQMVTVLDTLYGKVLDGLPGVSQSVDELADDYLKKYDTAEDAANSLIRFQIAKCGTSGFLTGLGGLITLPVAIPANVSSVLYVQLRMIAAIAKMGGFDIHSDQVQTVVYACLTGTAVADVLKQTGIKIGQKITVSAIDKIPGKVLIAINQKVGFRLVTKFGEKGMVNLVKLVPVAGGVVGGTVDVLATNVIASNAFSIFIKKTIPDEEEQKGFIENAKKQLSTAGEAGIEIAQTAGDVGTEMIRTAGDIGTGIAKVAGDVGTGVVKTAGDVGTGIAKTAGYVGNGIIKAVGGFGTGFVKSVGQIKMPSFPNKTNNSEEKNSGSSVPDEIRRYKELMDEGIITEEEFTIKKKQLLDL